MNLPDGLLFVCILMAGGMVVGTIALALVTDRRADRHPGGRAGALKDQALTLAPTMLLCGWMGLTFFLHDYLTAEMRIGAFVVIGLTTFAWVSLPVVKRALERTKSLRKYPPQ